MGISATVTLECDKCGTENIEDLEMDQSPEDIVDRDGWLYEDNITSKRVLCEDCYNEEENV